MPLLQSGLVSRNLYSTIIAFVWIWTRAVAADDANGVYVYANQTSVFTLLGDWSPVTSIEGKWGGNWINGTHPDDATTPTTLSYSFNGTTFVAFGSVVNGDAGSTMALNVKMDGDPPTSPAYQPQNETDGVDIRYQLYTNTSLTPTTHTFTLEITGETSPFLLQGLFYIPSSVTHAAVTELGSTPSPTETQAQSSSSNDSAKLGGAIGGGLGALLLVGLVILYMMRRIRKVETEEKQLAARPFVSHQSTTTRSLPGTSRHTPSASATALNTPMTRKKEPSLPSTSSGTPLKRPLPSSSNSAPSSQVNTVPYSPPTAPHRSPAQSIISVPSEYQATTVGPPGGTAVASSYIGTTPLPDLEGAPPVPAIPADIKRKSKASKAQSPREPETPNSGLGLFSSDSLNSTGTASSGLARPLPIVPGTRSSAPAYSFPPEKVGLTPAPRREGSTSKRKKRPLPDTS